MREKEDRETYRQTETKSEAKGEEDRTVTSPS